MKNSIAPEQLKCLEERLEARWLAAVLARSDDAANCESLRGRLAELGVAGECIEGLQADIRRTHDLCEMPEGTDPEFTVLSAVRFFAIGQVGQQLKPELQRLKTALHDALEPARSAAKLWPGRRGFPYGVSCSEIAEFLNVAFVSVRDLIQCSQPTKSGRPSDLATFVGEQLTEMIEEWKRRTGSHPDLATLAGGDPERRKRLEDWRSSARRAARTTLSGKDLGRKLVPRVAKFVEELDLEGNLTVARLRERLKKGRRRAKRER